MFKRILWTSSLLMASHVYAEIVVDLYGANKEVSAMILKKYTRNISRMEEDFLRFLYAENNDLMKKNRQLKTKLVEKIKKDGEFLWVDLNTVMYPGSNKTYTTVEVVSKDQPERLKYITAPITGSNKNQSDINDIISQMQKYEELSHQLTFKNQLGSNFSCPVYHCTVGFEHPKLKPYLKLFNEGATKEKQTIINVLADEKMLPERRGAAAFLMGHFTNPQEIISRLSPYVTDKNDLVRNNVIRVITFTLEKSQIKDIDLSPFIALLASPYTTDRNKSLAVIHAVADSPEAKKVIINNCSEVLIEILKLKQPDNHDFSYQILRKISGENFAENDLDSWKKWLVSARMQ